MLQDFFRSHRQELLIRTRQRMAAAVPSEGPMEGLEAFMDQVIADVGKDSPDPNFAIAPPAHEIAADHGRRRERQRMDVARVVYDFGIICDTMATLAVEHALTLSAREWRMMN